MNDGLVSAKSKMSTTAKYLNEALAFLPEPHASALRVLAHEPEPAHVLDVVLGLALSAKAPLDFIPVNGETWDICRMNIRAARDAAVAIAEDDPTKLFGQPTPFVNVLSSHLPTQYRRDLALLTPGRAEHLEALARFVFGGPPLLLSGGRQPYSEKNWMEKQIALLVNVQRLEGAPPVSAPSNATMISTSQAPSGSADARAASSASATRSLSGTTAGTSLSISVSDRATHNRSVPPVGRSCPPQSSASKASAIPPPPPPASLGQKRKKASGVSSSSGSNDPKRAKTSTALTTTPKLAVVPPTTAPSSATSSTSSALERSRSNKRTSKCKVTSTTSGADKAVLYLATSIAPFARPSHLPVNVHLTESTLTYEDWGPWKEDPGTLSTLQLNELERAFMLDTRAERSNLARWTVALLPADSYRDAGNFQYIFTLEKLASPQETSASNAARLLSGDLDEFDVMEPTEPAVRAFMAAFPRDIAVSYPKSADVTVLAKRGASAKEAGHIWFLDVGMLFGLRKPFSWWEAADMDHIHIVLDRTAPASTLSIEIRRRSHSRPTTFYAHGEEATVENYDSIRSWYARRLQKQGVKSKFEMM